MTAQAPGDYIRELMQARGWTQSDLAYALGMPPGSVNPILNNKRAISTNMARALAVALDMDAIKIAGMQAAWDVAGADDPDPGIASRARILSKYPLREMTRRGWIDPDNGDGSLEEQVCRFFGVSSLEEVPHISHSAKKTSYDHISPEQLAWLFRVRQIAVEMTPPRYDRNKLLEAVERFEILRGTPDGVRHVPRLLDAAGVRFVVVEGVANSAIDGVCFWLRMDAPVVGMSLRYDRIDNFWFVLRHECAHVLHGHGRDEVIIDCDLKGGSAPGQPEEERIANDEAADFCVPSAQMQSFYLRKKPYFAEREVVAFAMRVGVHPGLVVGQLQRRMDQYDFLRKHLVKIRDTLAMAMMMDGWGNRIPTAR
jgi:HTH-type transcriptional regulator/antitoxin HigA